VGHYLGEADEGDMNWIEKVLADNSFSKQAQQLAKVVSQNLSAFGQAKFYDSDCLAFTDGFTRDDVRAARLELIRRGYLADIGGKSRTGKPYYALRHDGRAVNDGEAA
jgi:hypothetical protein